MRPGSAGETPQQVAGGIGHDLHAHAVTAVLLREVGPAVADAVTLNERPVEQDVIRVGFPQDPQQSGCLAGQVLDDSLT